MLDDRSYMQSPPVDRRPVIFILLIVLVVAYVLQSCLMYYGGYPIDEWLGLSLNGIIKEGRLWQLFTFQFLHATPYPWHLLFNCFGLYVFGRGVEEALGKTGFLRLYFLSGTFGGILQLFATWALHKKDDLALGDPVVGASAGVCGLLAAFATLFPMRDLTVFLYVVPITIRAQYFFWFILLLSFYGTLVPFDRVAHAAHLGGLLMGWAYIRWGVHNTSLNWRPFRTRQRKRELVKAASVKISRWSSPKSKTLEELPPEEFISREVDPILDKISAHCVQSLI